MDVFGGEVGSPVGAIIEVAGAHGGAPIVTNRLSLEATSDQGRFRAAGALPIGALPPGDYIARAIVVVDGHPGGMVVRAFRKVGQ